MRHRAGGSGRRPRRVAEQVREVVAAFLQVEARDPRIGFVTITSVDLTPDLHYATVHYTVRGDAAQQEQTEEGLAAAAKAVRRRLGDALGLRVVPEVVFKRDHGREHAAHIESLLAELHKPEEPS